MYFRWLRGGLTDNRPVLLVLVASSFTYEYGTPIALWMFPPKPEPPSPRMNGSERPPRRPKVTVAIQHGYIWMTDEKNYR
jgi:hypothetical protein